MPLRLEGEAAKELELKRNKKAQKTEGFSKQFSVRERRKVCAGREALPMEMYTSLGHIIM